MIVSSILTGVRDSAMRPARPAFKVDSWPMRMIQLNGSVDWLSLEGFERACSYARKDDRVSRVLIFVNSDSCTANPADLAEAVHWLNEKKLTLSFIRCAIGGSFLAAVASRGVFAAPDAEIGLFGVVATDEAAEVPEDFAMSFDEAFLALAKRYCPGVADRVWEYLVHQTICSGEHCEAAGLVDVLARSEKSLVETLRGQGT